MVAGVFVLSGGSSKPQATIRLPSAGDVDASCCANAGDNTRVLVARYSPVLLLAQDDYDPMEVQAFFNQPGQRGETPDGCLTDVMPRPAALQPGQCPTEASILANGLQRLRFNIIGGNLSDPSTYATIYKTKVAPKYAAVTYAEVKTGNGLLTIDYWFFYLADFAIGNLGNHEGDWERAQVRIAASSVDEALTVDPNRDAGKVTLAYSRHRCDGNDSMPTRAWNLTGHDGTHAFVYVGSGSHANYFDAGGDGGRQAPTLVDGSCVLGGVGDSTPAQRRVAPTPVLIDCAAHLPAWTAFTGGWGLNGPRGPCQHN